MTFLSFGSDVGFNISSCPYQLNLPKGDGAQQLVLKPRLWPIVAKKNFISPVKAS